MNFEELSFKRNAYDYVKDSAFWLCLMKCEYPAIAVSGVVQSGES